MIQEIPKTAAEIKSPAKKTKRKISINLIIFKKQLMPLINETNKNKYSNDSTRLTQDFIYIISKSI